jgi:hypothetical protein
MARSGRALPADPARAKLAASLQHRPDNDDRRGEIGDRGGAKKQKMTETEKLIRDIQTLRESIQIDLADLASNPLREEKRKNIRVHIELCQIELKNLLERLWSLDDDNSN